jgi:hypothetical protein
MLLSNRYKRNKTHGIFAAKKKLYTDDAERDVRSAGCPEPVFSVLCQDFNRHARAKQGDRREEREEGMTLEHGLFFPSLNCVFVPIFICCLLPNCGHMILELTDMKTERRIKARISLVCCSSGYSGAVTYCQCCSSSTYPGCADSSSSCSNRKAGTGSCSCSVQTGSAASSCSEVSRRGQG